MRDYYSPDCLHVSFDSSDVDEVVEIFLLRKLLFSVLSLLALFELLVVFVLLFSSWFSLVTLSSSSTGSPFFLIMSTATSMPCRLEATAWRKDNSFQQQTKLYFFNKQNLIFFLLKKIQIDSYIDIDTLTIPITIYSNPGRSE